MVTPRDDKFRDDQFLDGLGSDDGADKTEIFETSDIISSVKSALGHRHVLVRMDPLDAGCVWAPSEVVSRIGRATGSALRLTVEGVSRHHCTLRRTAAGFLLEDEGSANGTFVNGVRITQKLLQDADLVQVGPRAVFRYSVTDAQQEQLMRQLYEASVTDALTGAFKREYLMMRLKGELSHARRHGTRTSVLMLDIDHFKNINDTHGHPGGDAVLVSMAAGLRATIRTEDVLARYGGEEFVILLPGETLEGARRAGERLRDAALTAPVRIGKRKVHYTISVGCASDECSEEKTPAALIEIADRRLYLAKHGGRNRVVWQG